VLCVEGRGALKRELVLCLRTGRALRAPRERSRRGAWAHVAPEALIGERPAEAGDRAVPGRWEGDLLIGLERSAIGAVVERTTRLTITAAFRCTQRLAARHTPAAQYLRTGHHTPANPPHCGRRRWRVRRSRSATATRFAHRLACSPLRCRGRMLRLKGRSVAHVARELGVDEGTLGSADRAVLVASG